MDNQPAAAITPPHSATLPTLETPRLRLRMVHSDDRDALFRVFSAPQAMVYWSCPPYRELSQADALIADIHQLCQQRKLFQWGIAQRDDDQVIGTCTLAWLDWNNLRAEIGFILHPDYWRRGLISEALSRLLNHAFDDLGLQRIEADVDPHNQASIRTLERLGFVREGLLRERWRVGGDVQDACFYGLLRREWQAPAAAPPRDYQHR